MPLACTAPAPKPCRNRTISSRIGDQMPATAYVGNRPIANVAVPIRKRVATMTNFRPSRSPYLEKNRPPTGRAKKPMKSTPNDASMPEAVSYTHLRAHETRHDLVCRLLLEKK